MITFYLENQDFVIVENTLYLTDGTHTYVATSESGGLSPYLVGTTVEANNNIRASAVFLVPTDFEPTTLQWCFEETCDNAIETPVERRGE